MIDKDLQVYEVNLAVSNACNANCLFCPRSFVKPKTKFMSAETAKRIFDEVSAPGFKAEHPVVNSVCSENGEPFLNPEILDILRLARKAGHGVGLFSNFALLTPEIAKTVIWEGLIDYIHVNIDGLTQESYGAVKCLDLNRVEANIRAFVKIRNESGSHIRIFGHVISHYTYTQAVKKFFGVGPVKGNCKEFAQDGPETVEKWRGILNPEMDGIGEDSVMLWAERYNKVFIGSDWKCPNLDRVRHVAYINPEGNLYACCFDAGNDLVLGNIFYNSISEILNSRRRRQLIEDLEERNFSAVGWPCSRVDSCQGVNRGDIK